MMEQEKQAEQPENLMDSDVEVPEASLAEAETEIVGEDIEEAEALATSTPESELESIMAQLEKTVSERDEFKAALQRERADFVNFRKRIEREKAEQRAAHVADTVLKFLPVLDDFDRALATVPDDAAENGWLNGFSLIHKKFNDLLNQLGIVPIDPLGQPFDPNFHEAIGSEDSDQYASGTVTAVLQKGYMMDEKCIRAAMVKVAN
jgi:molecular chaperone GrpE